MRIAVKNGPDKQAYGKIQKHLDAARAENAAAMKELREQRKAAGAKRGEGRVGGVHIDAVMNAIATEGPEVMTSAAKGYWDDMKRMYPEISADDSIPGTDSANGRRNKYGVVKERWRNGRWEHFDKKRGEWVAGEITKRKGI